MRTYFAKNGKEFRLWAIYNDNGWWCEILWIETNIREVFDFSKVEPYLEPL